VNSLSESLSQPFPNPPSTPPPSPPSVAVVERRAKRARHVPQKGAFELLQLFLKNHRSQPELRQVEIAATSPGDGSDCSDKPAHNPDTLLRYSYFGGTPISHHPDGVERLEPGALVQDALRQDQVTEVTACPVLLSCVFSARSSNAVTVPAWWYSPENHVIAVFRSRAQSFRPSPMASESVPTPRLTLPRQRWRSAHARYRRAAGEPPPDCERPTSGRRSSAGR